MTGNGNGRERQAHLRDYWRTLWVGRRTIGAVFLIVVAIGIVSTWLQKPVYRASATLEISPRSQRVVKVDDVSQIGASGLGWSAEDRYFKTQLEVLKSRDVAQRAFLRLGLDQDPVFSIAKDPVSRFMDMLEIEPTQETVIVAISMEGSDPVKTATWVNEVANVYVERNLEQASKATADAVSSLLGQLDPLRENLQKREEAMFAYAREHKVYLPEIQRAAYNERLASLEKDLTATKLKRLELEAVFRKIEELDKSGGDYYVIPQVARDEVLRTMTRERGDLEAEQRKMLVTLKPGHFKVKESEAAQTRLSQRIVSETNRIISAIRTDYALAQAREVDLASEILATNEEALTVSEKSATYEMLKTDSTEAKRIYDLVAQRVKEVDLNSSLLRNNLAVIDRAIAPTVPVRPRRVLNLAVSMLMGFGLGIGIVFFLEYLDDRVRDSSQLSTELGLATLAVVPKRIAGGAAAESAVAEAFSSLRTAVHFSSLNRERRVVLVTSAGQGEGKTLTAVMLARAMARAGERVVLVDANLRSPRVHEMENLPVAPGLTDWLSSSTTGKSSATLGVTGSDGVRTITAGTHGNAPPELLASERFGALVAELKAANDWVLLDSPAVAGVTDAALLASVADMTILVARQAQTPREELARATEALRTASATIIGVVLNDVDLSRPENRHLAYPVADHRPARSTSRRRSAAL